MFDFAIEASQALQAWLCENGMIDIKKAGTLLIEEGLVSNHVVILLKGEVAVIQRIKMGHRSGLLSLAREPLSAR